MYKYRTDPPYLDLYIQSSDFTIGAQAQMSWTVTDTMDTFLYSGENYKLSLNDWVYSDEPEGDGYTLSTSGGGPRRYPLIMTNLFDRQRSDYAIGKTHKDLNTGNLF